MIEDFVVNGRLFDVVIALIVWRVFYKLKISSTNGNVSNDLKKLKAQVETSYVEMWDYLEQTMKPIRSRLETRARRESKRESEDLKEEIPTKKGGIIRKADYKKYGID